jgi:hypothetical protein
LANRDAAVPLAAAALLHGYMLVAGALARDLPITLVNRAGAAHAFDISEDSEAIREAIRGALLMPRAFPGLGVRRVFVCTAPNETLGISAPGV